MRRLLITVLALAALSCAAPPPPRTADQGAGTIPEPEVVATPKAPMPPLPPAPRSEPAPPAVVPLLPTAPVSVRVGLETDLDEIRLPCCAEELFVEAQGRRFRVKAPLVVAPDGHSDHGEGAGWYSLQVAALRDEGEAQRLKSQIGREMGQPSAVHFDAGTGLYRVRVGRYRDRGAAEAAQRTLQGRGVPSSWVVSEGARLDRASFRLLPGRGATGFDPVRLSGRWLLLTTESGVVRWGDRRFRGRLLVYLNDRGRLNLINELDLEDYVRSVVPAEMGPELYDRLEALKAQAVAARTYTLRHLGEFRREGFDICATPRCQVYRGMASEHPLSDRAVAETAGQVLLYGGALIDSRYSATCGGHTEDVGIVFPLEDEPYLRGVPCPEAGPTTLPAAGLARSAPSGPAEVVPARLGRRPERAEEAFFLALDEGHLRVRQAGHGQRRLPLARDLSTFRREGGSLVPARLDLLPGDRLTVWLDGGRVVSLAHEAEPHERSYRRHGSFDAWTRFRTDQTLAAQVAARYPGLGFTGLEVLTRGTSGRVGRLRVLGQRGESVEVEGLAVRWVLDVPDTRFQARRTADRQGRPGWLFSGSGWGHGVGMCQIGSVNLAGRGSTYREILEHYYTGVELAVLPPAPPEDGDRPPRIEDGPVVVGE